MKQPQVYKTPKCSTGKCADKKAPSKRKNVKPDYDWSKMTPVGNADERASVDQQSRKPKRGQRTAKNKAKK